MMSNYKGGSDGDGDEMGTMVPHEGEQASGMTDEMCVPVESLAQPDEAEQMVNPEVGDPVAMHVEGKITRIEGGNAYVKPETVNGKPLDSQSEKVTDNPEEQEKKELYGMAETMDEGGHSEPAGGMA